MDTTSLLGLTRPQMVSFFESLGEKRFRATQVFKWLHQQLVEDFELMTNVSKTLKSKLKTEMALKLPGILTDDIAADSTRKWMFQLEGGNAVETVFIPEDHRGTLCISSQVGCALNCSFCSTGKQGFSRDLTAAEIIVQVWLAAKFLRKSQSQAISNVVFMGMGEPLLNCDNVLAAIHVLLDDQAYGLAKRRVTVSTSGIIPGIVRLAQASDVSLAVSLHAPNNELRDEIVPINKKYPIDDLMEACRQFIDGKPRRRVTLEYVMLAGVNDSPWHARLLSKVIAKVPNKINLIPFNPFPGTEYQCSSTKHIERFREILIMRGETVTIRKTRGQTINAACGQLVGAVTARARHQHSKGQAPTQFDYIDSIRNSFTKSNARL